MSDELEALEARRKQLYGELVERVLGRQPGQKIDFGGNRGGGSRIYAEAVRRGVRDAAEVVVFQSRCGLTNSAPV